MPEASEKELEQAIKAAGELSDPELDDPRDQWIEDVSKQADEWLDEGNRLGERVAAVKGSSEAAQEKRAEFERQQAHCYEQAGFFHDIVFRRWITESEEEALRDKVLAGGGGGAAPGGQTNEAQDKAQWQQGYDWARANARKWSLLELVCVEKSLALQLFLMRLGRGDALPDPTFLQLQGKQKAIEDELRRRMDEANRRDRDHGRGSRRVRSKVTTGTSTPTQGSRGPKRSAVARKLLPTYRTARAAAVDLSNDELLDTLVATGNDEPSTEAVAKVVALTNEIKTRVRDD